MDGYPAENVYAADLRQEFIDFGHQLYDDTSTTKIHFFADDVFRIPYPPPAPPKEIPAQVTDLAQLQGHVNHVYAGALFHLFDEETQYDLALRIVSLVKRVPGTTIYGRQMGDLEPHVFEAMSVNLESSAVLMINFFTFVPQRELSTLTSILGKCLEEGFHGGGIGRFRGQSRSSNHGFII